MNPRVREIAVSAGMTKMNQRSDGLYVVSEEVFDNFSKLIVRECIETIQNESMNSGDEWKNGLHIAKWAIKEHFGVEE